MKRLILTVLMMTCSFAWAKWEIVSLEDKFIYYLDKSTIRKNGVIAKVWSMIDFFELQTEYGNKYKSQKMLFAYNCLEETFALISMIKYSDSLGEGGAIFSSTIKQSDLKWSPIIPETYSEVFWKIACG